MLHTLATTLRAADTTLPARALPGPARIRPVTTTSEETSVNHRATTDPARDRVTEPLPSGHWALPGVHQAMASGAGPSRADVEAVLSGDAELIPAPDGAVWHVAGDTAVLVAHRQDLVLHVIHIKHLRPGRLHPGVVDQFVPVVGKLMDRLRAAGITRAVVAGTVTKPERTVTGPPGSDGVSWRVRGPFRALVASKGLVLHFELDEGELPPILTKEQRAARAKAKAEAKRRSREQEAAAPDRQQAQDSAVPTLKPMPGPSWD